MTHKKLGYSEAKRILITEYLSRLGIEPVKVRHNEYWYHSPFREDRTPSFKVNNKRNLWYDHGVGKGGTILDLGIEIHHCTIRSFISRLEEENFVPFPQQEIPPRKPELEILSTGKIRDPDLIRYLSNRGIDFRLATLYCVEVEYQIRSGKTNKAIAFRNDSMGYELRNKWFKGSSSPKTFSTIFNGSNRVCVFEGFMDFLSLLQLREGRFKQLAAGSSFVVLNSLAFLDKALPTIKQFSEINLFLDNDPAGLEAKKKFKDQGIAAKDVSTLYPYYKDLNEYLWNTQRKKEEIRQKLGPPIQRLRK
jgi:hypothetical protein